MKLQKKVTSNSHKRKNNKTFELIKEEALNEVSENDIKILKSIASNDNIVSQKEFLVEALNQGITIEKLYALEIIDKRAANIFYKTKNKSNLAVEVDEGYITRAQANALEIKELFTINGKLNHIYKEESKEPVLVNKVVYQEENLENKMLYVFGIKTLVAELEDITSIFFVKDDFTKIKKENAIIIILNKIYMDGSKDKLLEFMKENPELNYWKVGNKNNAPKESKKVFENMDELKKYILDHRGK